MYMHEITLCLSMIACVVSVSTKTQYWLWKNKHVFQQMIYNKEEIMDLKDEPTDFKTAKLNTYKTFWSKETATPGSCGGGWQWQIWKDIVRKKRSECSACCTTELSAIAPIKVDYSGSTYDVYHPTSGYQILFIGNCSKGATCSSGSCEAEDDYHTWILIHDPALRYEPKIRFVPVGYAKFCKCGNN